MTKREPSLASEVAAMREELREVRKDLRRAAKFEEHWKGLDVFAQPLMGVGLFVLGAALPMIVSGAQSKDTVHAASNTVGGTVLLLIGVAALMLPIQLQGYFLGQPRRIYSFFRELEKNEGRNPLNVMQEWAAKQGDAARGVRVAIAQTRFVMMVGFWTLALFLLAFLALYLALVTLIVARDFSPNVAGFVLAGVALGLVGAVILIVRRKKKRADRDAW